jgi:hypothetical protein
MIPTELHRAPQSLYLPLVYHLLLVGRKNNFMQLITTGAFMMISYAVSRNNFGIFQKDLTFNIYNNGSYLRFLYYIRNTELALYLIKLKIINIDCN